MKPSTILSSLFLAAASSVAIAAPVAEENGGNGNVHNKRTAVVKSNFNGFQFANQNLAYLQSINSFDLQSFVQLSTFNNLDISGFQQVFVSQAVTVDQLLQLQQVALLGQLSSLGAFGNFDLSTVQLSGGFNWGVIGNSITGFGVGSLVPVSVVPQITTVVSSTPVTTVIV